MERTIGWVFLVVILGGGAAAYYYWQQKMQEPVSPPLQAEAPPAQVSTEPAIRHPVETAPAQPLPVLGESDAAIGEALAELLGKKSLTDLFYPDRMIRRIVATIDNLPRKKAPARMMPVKPVPPPFAKMDQGNDAVMGTGNSKRYAPYVKVAQAVDAGKLADVYIRFYPLFQQAYEELGYPKGYFNDRLVEALDNLLDAPDIKGPIKLVQPRVMYEFADPALEARSAGQKIMIRMGSENAAKVKAKLREIRHEVTRRDPKSNRP
jgi:Protein of unknown function (DUF3014)